MRGAAVVALLAGCTIQVPPPQVPEPIVPRPNVVLGPPAPGEGDVLIDTVGGAADVRDIGGIGSGAVTRTVCTTPCEVHLSQGLHDLEFIDQVSGDWRGTGRITVGASPSAYRYALGHTDVPVGALSGAALLVVTGLSLILPAALDSSGTLTGIAIGTTALGALGLYLFRPKVQHGTGVQWTPQPGAPPASRAPGADLR
jgi:hypothetical protein